MGELVKRRRLLNISLFIPEVLEPAPLPVAAATILRVQSAMQPLISYHRMPPPSAAPSRVLEWQQRKADRARDPLFGPADGGGDAVLTGTIAATATLGTKIIAATANAITTNAGARVWFPSQHVDKLCLAPSAKRWR